MPGYVARPVFTVIVAGALLAMAACAPSTAPEPDQAPGELTLEPGACLEGYAGDDSDRESLIACTELHTFDVVGSVTWPEMEERIAATTAKEVFDDIQADTATELNTAYWNWARPACEVLLREAVGIGGLTIEGVSVDDLLLTPADLYVVDPSLATVENFESGDTSTVCSLRWGNADYEDIEIAHPEGISVLDLMSPQFPTERRSCFTRPEGGGDYAGTACSEPHSGQYLAYFDGLPALGAEFLATLDPTTKLFSDYGPLDEYCTVLLEAMYPGVLNTDDWVVWSDALDYLPSWEEFDGTIDPEGIYPVYCGTYGGDGGSVTGDAIALTAS